jgi:hypothetical protein
MSFSAHWREVIKEIWGMQMTSSKPSTAGLVVFECGRRCLRAADADADEAVPMPMVRPSNRLSKIVVSVYRSISGDNSV